MKLGIVWAPAVVCPEPPPMGEGTCRFFEANYYNGSRLRPKDGDNARPQQIREALHMQTTAAEG